MLKLGKVEFKIDRTNRDTAFFASLEEEKLDISFDMIFHENEYEGEMVTPGLSVLHFKTEAKDLKELIGQEFMMEDMDLVMEREDTFYLYEHEPFLEYQFSILEIREHEIHLNGRGTAIIDGYADPYLKESFSFDEWLPIITCSEDWDIFGI